MAARFVDLARKGLDSSKLEPAMNRAVTEQLPAMRDSLAQVCTEGKWSADVRRCLVQASDHVGFEACEQQLTDEQRSDLDRATRGNAESPK